MKKLFVSVALASLSLLAWAVPTPAQVEAEVRQGHYAQAESMMREVVAAQPGSARAHYLYAEILAHDGNLALAAEEAKSARTIDPDVKFADPEKFRTFEAALLRAQSPAVRTPVTPLQRAAPAQAVAPVEVASTRVAPAPASVGMPSWVWLAGLAAVAFVLWRFFSRSRAAPLAGGLAAPGAGYG
ncbi:MAG: tetratricopeptide repeat protein, partial [Pseudomonadota bacterium]|nr:tetratricopeptide repeat protein [Pseudomonadota bacterium]